MAMMTTLQMVTPEQLAELIDQPTTINNLDQPADMTCIPSLNTSCLYFWLGDAYPDPEVHPGAAALMGVETIETPTLENGCFEVVPPSHTATIAASMREIDYEAIKAAVADAVDADLHALVDEEELYDLELVLFEDLPAIVTKSLQDLAAFYERAAGSGAAVVMYTS